MIKGHKLKGHVAKKKVEGPPNKCQTGFLCGDGGVHFAIIKILIT
jgi:hypothetical protein